MTEQVSVQRVGGSVEVRINKTVILFDKEDAIAVGEAMIKVSQGDEDFDWSTFGEEI